MTIYYSHIGLNIYPIIVNKDCSIRFDAGFDHVDPAAVKAALEGVIEVRSVDYVFSPNALRVTISGSQMDQAFAYEDCVIILKDIDRVEYLLRDVDDSVFAALDFEGK